jgi:hypothetical protein
MLTGNLMVEATGDVSIAGAGELRADAGSLRGRPLVFGDRRTSGNEAGGDSRLAVP